MGNYGTVYYTPCKLCVCGCVGDGVEGYTVFMCPFVCMSIHPSVKFWFLHLILLNNLSEGMHFLVWVSYKYYLFHFLFLGELSGLITRRSKNVEGAHRADAERSVGEGW